MAIRSRFDTHEVFNQSPPYEDVDLFTSDAALVGAVKANGAALELPALSAFGKLWGTAKMFARGRQANENAPKLHAFDPKGHRLDTVEFHPAYHTLMRESVAAGLHASTWTAAGQRAPAPAEVLRTARFYMAAQVETGHLCPLTMTRAALAPLAAAPELLAKIAAKVTTRNYEGAFRPWWEKAGMTLGMGMTETQGGTDVRANTTTATPDGDGYTIVGAKWFMSAPMSDAFLILAQAPGGLTCFLMPRFRPDGTVNALALPAPQGQARQPLQCLERSGIHRRLCLAHRRRRRRHPHHHSDGAIDAARLRGGVRGFDAHGAHAGRTSLPVSQCVRQAPDRAADDAYGARRHGARCRGRSGACGAAVARARSCRRRIRAKRPMRGS